MKKILWSLLAVVIIAAVGFGGFKVYGMGYDTGEKKGFDSGYTVGEDAGYQSGQKDGYEQGNTEGFQTGREQGYTEGYSTGEQDGFADGETTGYARGVNDGLGHGYTIRDETYAQVLDFLAKDKTDTKPYIVGFYVCTEFSRDVCNNAEAAGIRCAVVALSYRSGTGHMIVAFNTLDQGLVYFEPQSDERAEPAVGKHYYQTVIPRPGYFYEAPGYDDTIEDMVLIW